MVGGLVRLLALRVLPRRILPALLLYDVFRMFRRRATNQRFSGSTRNVDIDPSRSSGGRW